MLVVALALLIGARICPAGPATPTERSPQPAREAVGWDRLLAAYGVVAFAIWVLLAGLQQLHAEPLGFDATSAYLPTAARWIQSGSIWEISDWLPNFFFGASPGNGSVLVLSWLLPWKNEFLAHLAIYPFVAMTVVAIHAVCRELGAPRSTAALIGVTATAAPVIVQPGLINGLLDPVLYAMFATGIMFLVRHSRTARQSDLLLAGTALGIAFGTKYYGFTAVPALITVWVLAQAGARVPLRLLARRVALVLAPVLLFGGIWMVRNWVDTGNPLFPVRVEVLGITIFDAPADPLRSLIGSTLADYIDAPSVWTSELAHQFRIAIGGPLLVMSAAFALALAVLVRRRARAEHDRTDAIAWSAIAATLLIALSYALTPYSAAGAPGDPYIAAANVRYGIPALIVAAGLAGWVAPRVGRRGMLLFELACLAALVDALRIGATTPRSTVYVAFALAAAALLLWSVGRTALARLPVPSLPALAALSAISLIGLALAGTRTQATYNDTRYLGFDLALDWVVVHTSGAPGRIGLAGSWTAADPAPIYPLFGPRLENEVDYVGPVDDGSLGTYKTRAGFLDGLRNGDYRFLVVGLAPPFGTIEQVALSKYEDGPPEGRWARSAGFAPVAESDRFVVMARELTR